MIRIRSRLAKAAPLILFLFAGGCVTLIGSNRPHAVDMTVEQAKYDLECMNVQATVLSEQVVHGTPADSTEHTIGVSGCGRQATYVAHCRDELDCSIKMTKGEDQYFKPEVLP